MNAAERFLAASRSRNVDAAVSELADNVVMLNATNDEPVAVEMRLRRLFAP
jgi:hypothetical protein